MRTFHPAPAIVLPANKEVLPEITFDGDYLAKACPSLQDIYVAEDSDDGMAAASMTTLHDGVCSTISPPTNTKFQQTLRWAHTTDYIHRMMLRQKFRLHYQDLSDNWTKVEQLSDHTVDALISALQLFSETSDGQINYPLPPCAFRTDDNTTTCKAVDLLLHSKTLGSSRHRYSYLPYLQLGLTAENNQVFIPPSRALEATRKAIAFGNEKKTVAINPFSSDLQKVIPPSTILDFMVHLSDQCNFVITGSTRGFAPTPALHPYWAWEYYSFFRTIKILPFVKNCVTGNFLLNYCVPMCTDYFISTFNSLGNTIMRYSETPTLIFGAGTPHAEGYTAFGDGVIIDCDLVWGLTVSSLYEYFFCLVENQYGPAVMKPYTTLQAGLCYEQYVKKMLWGKICSQAFTLGSQQSGASESSLALNDFPLIQGFNPYLQTITSLREDLNILWDLQGDIFRHDCNASLFYSTILLNSGEFVKAEEVLEVAVRSFPWNPLPVNNLAIAKWNLRKITEATALVLLGASLLPQADVLTTNVKIITGAENGVPRAFSLKPQSPEVMAIVPDETFNEFETLLEQITTGEAWDVSAPQR